MSSLICRACLIASVACAASALAAAEFDHVHLNVANPAAATEWYAKNLGGRAIAKDAVAFGRVTIRFVKVAGPVPGSVTSAIDHIGFAYPDIAAKMRELAASDVEIVSGIEEEGPIKYAFVRDRWNTLLEIVEDAEITGFHHVHIATTDPKATLAWYKDSLGGERSRFAGGPAGHPLPRRLAAGQGRQRSTCYNQRALDRPCRLVGSQRQ